MDDVGPPIRAGGRGGRGRGGFRDGPADFNGSRNRCVWAITVLIHDIRRNNIGK